MIEKYIDIAKKILSNYNSEYYISKNVEGDFLTDIINEFRKKKLLTIFLDKNYGGEGLALYDYNKFIRLISKYDTGLALIYNQHVGFLKYFETFKLCDDKLLKLINNEQILCTLALSEIDGEGFFSNTNLNEQNNKVKKKAVTSAKIANLYMVNAIENGCENLYIADKNAIIAEKFFSMAGLNNTATFELEFDVSNYYYKNIDDNLKRLATKVIPWTSTFIIVSIFNLIDNSCRILSDRIEFKYDKKTDKYLYENEAIRLDYYKLNLLSKITKKNSFYNQDINLECILEDRINQIYIARKFLSKLEKFMSLTTFKNDSLILYYLNCIKGLTYISPSVFEISNSISKKEFGILS